MKVNCSACGAKNDKSISECQYCGATLIVASRKTSNNSSSSILNRGIALYKKGNYYKAEEVFLEVLENNKNDLIASMYLSFILNQGDFSNLKKDITTILQSTNDNDIKNTIYQSVLERYETLFQPEIKRIGLNKFEIEFDYIDFQLTEDFPGFLSELKALSALIMSFPQNYHQQFLKILIKRYQSPWTETYHFGRPLDELVFINDLDLLLKNNMEETKLLYSTISDLSKKIKDN